MVDNTAADGRSSSQMVYSEERFIRLLKQMQSFKELSHNNLQQIVESIRNLAEFLCYSEQYKLNYFDDFMQTDVLLVDLPRFL